MKACKKQIRNKAKKYFRTFAVSILILIFSTVFSFAGQKVYFYHTDAARTPLAMTDSSGSGGNVVWQADYKPFGEEQLITESIENKNRFVGKEKDEETGLYYFGARYMDAGIGRFVSVDPKGIAEKDLLNPQRLNRYNYSLNNPYRYIDPDGLDVWFIEIGTSAFIGGNSIFNKRSDNTSPSGIGTQAGYGIAYDTETEEFKTFATGGTAQPEDKVAGVNAGVGIVGGKLNGNMKDFLGEATEETTTLIIPSITKIKTSTSKEGIAISVGKGLGLSATTITTNTFDLKKRVQDVIIEKEKKK